MRIFASLGVYLANRAVMYYKPRMADGTRSFYDCTDGSICLLVDHRANDSPKIGEAPYTGGAWIPSVVSSTSTLGQRHASRQTMVNGTRINKATEVVFEAGIEGTLVTRVPTSPTGLCTLTVT